MRTVIEQLKGAALAVSVFVAAGALATEYTWDAAVAEGDWSDPNSWTAKSGYPASASDTAKFSSTTPCRVNVDVNITLGNLNLSTAGIDVTFTSANTNDYKLTLNGFNLPGKDGKLTLDRAAIYRLADITWNEGSCITVKNGSNLYVNHCTLANANVAVNVLGDSFMRVNYLYVGNSNVLTIADSVVRVDAVEQIGYSKPGGSIRFEGTHPQLQHNSASAFYSLLADAGTSLDFLVPVGGYTSAPIRYMLARNESKVHMGCNWNNALGSSAIAVNVLPESPAARVDAEITTPLIDWSNGIETSMIIEGTLPDETEGSVFSWCDEGVTLPTNLCARIVGTAHSNRLKISGLPEAVPSPEISPAYGEFTLGLGATRVCSAPMSNVTISDCKRATCTGWKSYVIDPMTRERTLVDSGANTSITFTNDDGLWHELEWQWDIEYSVTAVSDSVDRGTVSASEQWGVCPNLVTVTAAARAGYAFYKWTGDVGDADAYAATIVVPADQARQLTAVFGAKLTVGSEDGDYATLGAALAAAHDGDTIVLRTGTYELDAEIILSDDIAIRGATGRPEDVIIKATGTHRLFTLDSPGAMVADAFLTDGNAGSASGGAAYITANGGRLENCVVSNCKNTGWGVPGGGIYVAKDAALGLIDRCVVTNCSLGNRQGGGGGVALALYGGVARNSLFVGNRHSDNSGNNQNLCGTVKVSGGALVNCTVAKNQSYTCPGVWAESGRVVNCIIAENESISSTDAGYCAFAGDAACFANCVSPSAINDSCFAMAHPFHDAGNGDYTPVLGSVGVDTGLMENWMAGANDLRGNVRVSGPAPDAGAIEYDQSVFSAAFSAAVSSGKAPLDVTFAVAAVGATQGITCYWDWDGDGVVDDVSAGSTNHVFATAVAADVRLSVKDNATETVFNVPLPVTVKAYGDAIRVVKGNANAAPPYDNWGNAAATLEAAYNFAEDGCEIVVSNGTHDVAAQIQVLKAVTIRGLTGVPEDVILKAVGTHRMFWLANAQAKISGVTIQGGNSGATSGGGVYIDAAGGTVEHSLIRGCQATGNSIPGGGIYVAAGADLGLVDSCVISNCMCHREGDGAGLAIALYGGEARNCLITENIETSKNGSQKTTGSAKVSGGRLVNCTITKNKSYTCPGVWAKSGEVVNCIIAENTCFESVDAKAVTWTGEASCFDHCVGTDAPNGSCTALEHPFADSAKRDYTPVPGTAAFDGGVTEPWMADAKDLLGNVRVSGRSPDVGAIEYDQSRLSASFLADVTAGKAPLTVTFTVTPVGATGEISCAWDLDGDGVYETDSTGTTFTHTFTAPCAPDVRLAVTDGGSGQSYTVPLPTRIRAFGDAILVSATSAMPSEPYDSWTNAATRVEAAVSIACAGCDVVVSNGIYDIAAEMMLDRAVTVRGFTGEASDAILRSKKNSGNHRIFWINDPAAKVENLTLCNASMSDHGAGVYLDVKGGTLSHCVISNCTNIGAWGKSGGGVYITPGADAALVDSCVISGCRSHHEGGAGGAAISIAAGLVRNCLITGNDMNNVSGGPLACGSVRIVGGTFANCTVAGNQSKTCPGIVANYDAKTPNPGRVINCAIGDNTTQNTAGTYNTSWAGDPDCFVKCVGPEQINDTCFAGENIFVDAANGDFRLPRGSAFLDKGDKLDWMAAATDFFGGQRVSNGRPDLGYFELQVNGVFIILR